MRPDAESLPQSLGVLTRQAFEHLIKRMEFISQCQPAFGKEPYVVVSVCSKGVFPSERKRAQAATQSAGLLFQRRSRITWGALISNALN